MLYQEENGSLFGQQPNGDYSLLSTFSAINMWTILETDAQSFCFFRIGNSPTWDCVCEKDGIAYVSVMSDINSDLVVLKGDTKIDFKEFLKSKMKLRFMPLEDVEETDILAQHIKAIKELQA